MGRELQKRKNRSSINKVRRKPKSKKRILSNAVIAANWDKTQTLAQNYKRLGLTAKLNKNTGGVEKTASTLARDREEEEEAVSKKQDGLVIGARTKKAVQSMDVREVEVERDAQTGKILRVLSSEKHKGNPLNDPLNDLDSDSDSERAGLFDQHGNPIQTHGSKTSVARTAVVKTLEQEASRPVHKYKRKQPEGERVFVEELVSKYGEDYGAMARDMKINYMQRSEGDLKRRIKKWREAGGRID